AAALRDSLERQGLKTVLCETVHDAPDWSGAYGSSLASIEALKKQYPSLQVFVDVHRDSAIAGVSTKLKTAGEDVAKIMFVVGSNQRLAHPQWQQNQDFSQDLADLLETMAPDIIRGVRVSASRYNQHISTKAMLVEIGSTENTVEEAQRSAALLGEALAQLLAKDV
ncbi:MAG: stage II sporulation protein P, partial [Clostridiales bacterium]